MDTNEDFVIVDDVAGIGLVADGMGGRPGGSVASRIAATTFVACLRSGERKGHMDDGFLRDAIAQANREVRAAAETDELLTGLGTTLSAVVIDGETAKTVHIGDSRIYRFRAAALRQITKDHTVVAELLAAGHLDPERALTHPMRHMLSRAIGVAETVEPDIGELDLSAGDWLILTTDGVNDVVEAETLERTIGMHHDASPEKLCRSIVGLLRDVKLTDNATVAVIGFEERPG